MLEEQESFLELASSETLLAELQKVLSTDAQHWLTDLADGIHSGLERRDPKGMFFYFTAPPEMGAPISGATMIWRPARFSIIGITSCRLSLAALIHYVFHLLIKMSMFSQYRTKSSRASSGMLNSRKLWRL